MSAQNSPNPRQFAPIAVVMLVMLTAFAGAALGAIFAVVAHRRDEPAFPVRAVAFIANLALVAWFLYRLIPLRSP